MLVAQFVKEACLFEGASSALVTIKLSLVGRFRSVEGDESGTEKCGNHRGKFDPMA